MAFTDHGGFAKRPVVVVEDRFQHLRKLAEALQMCSTAAARDCLTYVCLTNDGPDTATEAARWLESRLALQVVLRDGPSAMALLEKYPKRLMLLPDAMLQTEEAYTNAVAQLVRPGGVLLQDIELEPLQFAQERPWRLDLCGRRCSNDLENSTADTLVHVEQGNAFWLGAKSHKDRWLRS